MAQLLIDLSGKGGLAPAFQGDLNDTTPTPNLRYIGTDSQVADGIYDPSRVAGFMAPANDTFLDLTGTIANKFISRVYSSSEDIMYLAQNGTGLSELAGLNDTSLSTTALLPDDSYFKDLELYEMNGFEAVLYSYIDYDSSESTQKYQTLGFKSVDTSKGAFQLAAQVDLALTADNTASQTITSTTNEALAQKFSTSDFFTVSSLPVTGVRVRLNMPFVGTTQTWTMRVGIQTDSAGSPSGSYVTNGYVDIDPNTLPVGGYDYVYVEFPATLSLTTDTTYYIVVEPTNTGDLGANEGVYWLSSYNDNSQYPDGETLKKQDGSWIQASFYSESFDFALVLNTYNYIGESESELVVDQGTITIGTAANNYAASSTTVSATQATTGLLNPLIIAAVFNNSTSDTITGITCDGVAMTFGQKVTIGTGGNYMYLYYAVGMSEGSHTITATASGSSNLTILTAAYYGVDQTTPMFLTTGSTGGSNETSYTFNISGFPPSLPLLPYVLGGSVNTNGNSGTIIDSPYVERSESASNEFMKWFDYDDVLMDPSSISTTIRTAAGTGTRLAAIRGWIRGVTPSDSPAIIRPIYEGDGNSFLQKADNGFMYWFTNNRVHKVDGGVTGGTSGRIISDVLVFPDYLDCVDAIDTNSLMYIGVQSTETDGFADKRNFNADTMGVYQWDRQSTVVNTRNFVPIYGAREIRRVFVNADGDLRVITIGEDGFTEIRGITNGRLQVLRRLGREAYPARRDSVDTVNNMVTWLGADGVVYALGKLLPGQPESLFKIGKLKGYTGTLDAGILMSGNDSSTLTQALFLSWADNSTKKLQKWYPHGTGTIGGVAQTGNQGDVYSLSRQLPYLANVHHIFITCAPGGSAGSSTTVATIKFYKNMETTPYMTKTVTRGDLVKGYLSYEVNKQYVNSLQFEIEWANQTLGSNDFLPAVAVVSYTPTKTIK